jgi:glycosyltransferase involved in cell wall biosynthesis
VKIWIIVPFEPIPGIDVNVRPLRYGYLASELLKRNHQVVWWTSDFNHFTKQNRYSKSSRIQLDNNLCVQLLYAQPYRKNISLARIRHNLSLARSFEKIAKSSVEKPDIIFVCLPTIELADKVLKYGRKNKIPVVVDIVDTWPDIYLSAIPSWLRPIGAIALAPDFRKSAAVLRSAKAITAVSDTYLKWGLDRAKRQQKETDKTFFLGYHIPEEYRSLDPSSIENITSKYGIRQENFVIVFLGQFASSYDLETIIHAARKLETSKNVQFVLAGDGDKMSVLKKDARHLSNVIFTGWLDHPTALSILRISSLGLCAYSKKALQSLPYKPFEYMAYGLPLLSSLKGELADMITTHNIGRNYIAEDATSLVKEINWFIEHPSDHQQMALNAKQLFDAKFVSSEIYGGLVKHLESLSIE